MIKSQRLFIEIPLRDTVTSSSILRNYERVNTWDTA